LLAASALLASFFAPGAAIVAITMATLLMLAVPIIMGTLGADRFFIFLRLSGGGCGVSRPSGCHQPHHGHGDYSDGFLHFHI
jgi:hypothetical protein